MYDELIKNLRHDSVSALQNCEFDFVHAWMLEAADAIEDLQKQLQKSEVDNINLTGWLAEEHAKQCPHYIHNVHDRGDDSLCDKWMCEIKSLPKWIPVTERLPEDRQRVLVFYWLDLKPKTPWCKVCYFASNLQKVDKYDFDGCNYPGFYDCDSEWGYYQHDDVTHWMPLPEPPESEGN